MANDDSGFCATFDNGEGNATFNTSGEKTKTNEERMHNRNIREKYKDLKADVELRGAEDTEVLMETMNQGDNYFSEVNAPREAVIDSTVVNLQSKLIKQRTQMLHTNLYTFVPKVFVQKLGQYVKKQKGAPKKPSFLEIWQSLGHQSGSIINATPPFQLMYGTFEPGTVELKKRTRKSRSADQLTNVVEKPLLLDASQSQNATTEEVERILAILHKLYKRNGGPLCYFEFVNSTTFSETVENIFYVSVLVKELAVRVFYDEDGLPSIEPLAKADADEAKLHGNPCQSILSISYQEWEDIAREFKLQGKQPLITSRRNK